MEGGDIRCWDKLIPDALGIIFSKVFLEEKLTVIPRICKSWRKAVMQPYCWQEINIEYWSSFPSGKPEQLLDRMLQMLIERAGSPRKLCVMGLTNDATFSFIADHAGSLETLQIFGSNISDSIVEKVAGRMSAITLLDLSSCVNIGARALEAFGSNCRLLSGLRRNMILVPDLECQDDEAHAIATTMPELKHLEIAGTRITAKGVLGILSGCQKLVSLDARGLLFVELSDEFFKEKYPGLKVQLFFSMDDFSFDIPTDGGGSGALFHGTCNVRKVFRS